MGCTLPDKDRFGIELKDKLDYNTASAMMDDIKEAITQGVRTIDFYCGELQDISDAGGRALRYINQKIVIDVEINIVMHNVTKPVRDVLALSGMDKYVNFTD